MTFQMIQLHGISASEKSLQSPINIKFQNQNITHHKYRMTGETRVHCTKITLRGNGENSIRCVQWSTKTRRGQGTASFCCRCTALVLKIMRTVKTKTTMVRAVIKVYAFIRRRFRQKFTCYGRRYIECEQYLQNCVILR